jgi:hypothetical protein
VIPIKLYIGLFLAVGGMCFIFAAAAGQSSGMLLGLFFLGWGAVVWYLRYGREKTTNSQSGQLASTPSTSTAGRYASCDLKEVPNLKQEEPKQDCEKVSVPPPSAPTTSEEKAEKATLAASEILQRNSVPIEQAVRIVEALLKAGEDGALAKLAKMAEERSMPFDKDSRTYLDEANQRIGFGIEQLAASGVSQQDARSVAQLLIYAGEENFHSKVSKN